MNENKYFFFPFLCNYEFSEIKRKLLNIINYNFELKEIGFGDTKTFQIYVCLNKLIGDGPTIDFVKVEKGITKKLEFSSNAPKWRKVKEGLNIFGICKNSKCEAFKNEVIYMTNLTDEGLRFNLNEEIRNIRCPICNKIMKPKTCGFWKCEYQFEGIKIEEGDEKEFRSNPKETKDDNFEYFDPFENDEVQWLELVIFVAPKQKIKYKKIK